MGGGDLNAKKSWHPGLLVNQERVWKAEKDAIEEKKKFLQLQKEREEERQLAELQRMQEAATGKKRVEKLDWMYAAPSGEGMGGRFSERELEDYLLGKKRVDEVLKQGDADVGNSHKDYMAVQNANTARDTASKIREDPMLAMKKAEQAALQALMNRPDVRRQLKAAKREKEETKEEKEERRAKRRAEKETKRERKRGDYSDEDEYRRRRDRDDRRRGDSRDRRDSRDRSRERRHRDDRDRVKRERDASRSVSPRRDRSRERRRHDRDDRDRRPRSPEVKREPVSSRYDDRRDPSPGVRREPESCRNGHSNGHEDRREYRNGNGSDYRNGGDRGNDYRNGNGHANGSDYRRPPPPRRPSPERKPTAPLDDMRAARLAAMSASAKDLEAERTKKLASRAEEERRQFEAEQKARSRYHKDEAAGLFMKHQEEMSGGVSLAETLQRRAGRGLQRDI